MTLKAKLKSKMLPPEPSVRRLPMGIGRGLSMHVDFAHATKIYLGLYEIELNREVRRLCQSGYNAYDLGANVGYDSIVMAKLTGARVLGLDEDPSAETRFLANVRANPELEPRISFRRAFVGAGPSPDGTQTSVDELARSGEYFVPDVIKCDVEGGEHDVLIGAREVIEEHHPSFLLEVHSRALEAQCMAYLDRFNYDLRIVDQRKWLKENRGPENRWLVATPLEQQR